jgi:hypothetical protein
VTMKDGTEIDDAVVDVLVDEYRHKIEEYSVLTRLAPDFPDPAGHFQMLHRLELIAEKIEWAFNPGPEVKVGPLGPEPGQMQKIAGALERIATALEALAPKPPKKGLRSWISHAILKP